MNRGSGQGTGGGGGFPGAPNDGTNAWNGQWRWPGQWVGGGGGPPGGPNDGTYRWYGQWAGGAGPGNAAGTDGTTKTVVQDAGPQAQQPSSILLRPQKLPGFGRGATDSNAQVELVRSHGVGYASSTADNRSRSAPAVQLPDEAQKHATTPQTTHAPGGPNRDETNYTPELRHDDSKTKKQDLSTSQVPRDSTVSPPTATTIPPPGSTNTTVPSRSDSGELLNQAFMHAWFNGSADSADGAGDVHDCPVEHPSWVADIKKKTGVLPGQERAEGHSYAYGVITVQYTCADDAVIPKAFVLAVMEGQEATSVEEMMDWMNEKKHQEPPSEEDLLRLEKEVIDPQATTSLQPCVTKTSPTRNRTAARKKARKSDILLEKGDPSSKDADDAEEAPDEHKAPKRKHHERSGGMGYLPLGVCVVLALALLVAVGFYNAAMAA